MADELIPQYIVYVRGPGFWYSRALHARMKSDMLKVPDSQKILSVRSIPPHWEFDVNQILRIGVSLAALAAPEVSW